MEDNSSPNLFDLSARSSKKKKPTSSLEPARTSTSTIAPTDQETQEMLAKMKRIHTDFSDKIDEVFQKSGKDPRELTEYFNDPKNFPPGEWEKFVEKKEDLEAKVTGLSAQSYQKHKEKKRVDQASKGRKGKTLGARKRWLDMR